MRLAFIVPIPHLEDFEDVSNFHLCLAHLFRHEEYFDFYKRAIDRGDYVILDNGAFEGEAVNSERLLELVERLMPAEVVAPDVLGNGEETVEKTKQFLSLMPSPLKKRVRVMGVVQGETPKEWTNCFFALKDLVDVFGVPGKPSLKNLHPFTRIHERIARLTFLKRQTHKPVHCLGMTGVRELVVLDRLGARSLDSSFAWTHTRFYPRFWEGEVIRKSNVVLKPDESKGPDYVKQVRANIYFLKALVGDV